MDQYSQTLSILSLSITVKLIPSATKNPKLMNSVRDYFCDLAVFNSLKITAKRAILIFDN